MLLLGIETSSSVSSVALAARSGPLAATMVRHERGHLEFLVPGIRTLVEQAGTSLKSVTGIAVGLGPGLFTSMRVGIATAKTMAQALSIPIVGLASLDVLAFGIRHSPRLICACVDARRGELFAALYRQVPGGVERLTEYAAWKPEDLAAELLARNEPVIFVGDGYASYRSIFRDLVPDEAPRALSTPSSLVLVELAMPRFEREEFTPVNRVEPLYVRKTDAELKWEQRGMLIERPSRVKVRGSKEAR